MLFRSKYPWPGNIRELENEVERVVVLSGDEPRVGEDMLSSKIRDFSKAQEEHKGLRVDGSLKEALEQLEKTMILEGLRRTGFNKSRLAKELGISRAGLIMKVEKYGLDKRKAYAAANGNAPGARTPVDDVEEDFYEDTGNDSEEKAG